MRIFAEEKEQLHREIAGLYRDIDDKEKGIANLNKTLKRLKK